jgi:two-component sensor histidine kinase
LPFFKQLTLRQGLILVVLAALFPVVVVSAIQGFATLENTRNLAVSRLEANARAVAERERDAFVIAQHLLMTVAANGDVRNMTGDCDSALAAGMRDYRPIANFARSDADGVVRCSVLPHSGEVNFAGYAWWQNGIKADRLTLFKSPVRGDISKRQILIMMLPLRDSEGNQDGALTAGIDVEQLRNLLVSAPEARMGSVAIVTAEGEIVAEGSQQLQFQPDMRQNKSGIGQIGKSASGTWMYSATRLYSDELFLLYAEPTKLLMSTAVSQVRVSILLPLVSILLASFAIWFGTNRLVVRWLKDLGRVANRFSKGEYTGDREKFSRAPLEIAELSADLHAMAEVIDKRSRELTTALDAKTELTREVHHRVKNNLQIITSLLTLQSSRVEEAGAKQVLAQTRARISALALIHRLLYEQDTENKQGHVLIDGLVDELCAQLRTANKTSTRVDLKAATQTIPVHIDLAVPLALFVVEAVTNAYRHAFPADAAGTITVEFNRNGDEASIMITDNGRGFQEGGASGQMGTELMNAFASQVEGRFDVESEIGRGTRVSLTFPLREKSPCLPAPPK